MLSINLQSRIAAIRGSQDYMLNHALDRGLQAACNYYPREENLKQAYESGLQVWLNENHMLDVKPHELSSPPTMRGFLSTLIVTRVLFLRDSLDDQLKLHPKQVSLEQFKERGKRREHIREACRRELEITLEQYKAFRKFGVEIEEDEQRFKKGISIAEDYYLQYRLDYFIIQGGAVLKYDLDLSTLPRPVQIKYLQIDEELQQKILGSYNQSTHKHDDSIYEELYDQTINELNNHLMAGELGSAMEKCTCLELLLRYTKKWGPGVFLKLSDDKKGLDVEHVYEHELVVNIVDERLENLRRLKKDIGKRMEMPLYDLEARLQELVAAEKYEEATVVRDEIKSLSSQ